MPASGDGWNDLELDAAVAAYNTMLADIATGRPVNKAAVNRQLREGALAGRSRGSVEFRMGNISAVRRDEGLPWIEGYKPYANTGSAIAASILAALRRTGIQSPDLEPESDEQRLRKKTSRLR